MLMYFIFLIKTLSDHLNLKPSQYAMMSGYGAGNQAGNNAASYGGYDNGEEENMNPNGISVSDCE